MNAQTRATSRVLTAITADPDHYGLDLARATGLKSGTLYPILHRLESEGWLASHWEERDEPGPRRRLYRLAEKGDV